MNQARGRDVTRRVRTRSIKILLAASQESVGEFWIEKGSQSVNSGGFDGFMITEGKIFYPRFFACPVSH